MERQTDSIKHCYSGKIVMTCRLQHADMTDIQCLHADMTDIQWITQGKLEGHGTCAALRRQHVRNPTLTVTLRSPLFEDISTSARAKGAKAMVRAVMVTRNLNLMLITQTRNLNDSTQTRDREKQQRWHCSISPTIRRGDY